MSVYHRDDPVHLEQALDSIVNQTRMPDQVVVVADGPLTDVLENVLCEYKSRYNNLFFIMRLAIHQCPAKAWNHGLSQCRNDLVARMDADDISLPQRFEKQVDFFGKNPQVDVVGSYYSEFEKDVQRPVAMYRPPTDHKKILRYARTRNPLCHPSVMYKKQSVMDCGGYINIPGFTDYYLWVRMLKSECVFANIPEVLLHYRGGREIMARRGGLAYIRNEYVFFKESYRLGFISLASFAGNVVIRPFIRILPAAVRKKIYQKLLRDPVK